MYCRSFEKGLFGDHGELGEMFAKHEQVAGGCHGAWEGQMDRLF